MVFRTLLVLGRVSNLPTVWTNVIAAWFLAGGNWSLNLVWTMLGGSLLYVGGMAMNDAFDAAWDKKHGKDRPIAQGKISARVVWIYSLTCMGAGTVLMALAGANPGWVAALVGAIVAYNWLHKRWEGSIWIMGACRMFLFVAAASVITPMPGSWVWFWAVGLLAYVAGVTLAARGESTGGNVKLLAPVLLAFPVILGLIRVMDPSVGGVGGDWRIQIGWVGVLLSWLVLAYQRLRKNGAIGAFVASLLAGMVLVDAVAVSSVSLFASAVCAVALPLNRLLQRFVPAT